MSDDVPRDDITAPVIGCITRLNNGEETGIVLVGDLADDNETTVLIVPLTRDCRDALRARLVAAFHGDPRRFEYADRALAAVGIGSLALRKGDAA